MESMTLDDAIWQDTIDMVNFLNVPKSLEDTMDDCPLCGAEILMHNCHEENTADAHNVCVKQYMCGTIVETDTTVAKGEDC